MRLAPAALLLLSALLFPPRAGAQSTPPDTPAARAMSGWLDAFNSGSMDSVRRFLAEHAPNAAADQRLLHPGPNVPRFRDATGGFDFRLTESSTPTRLVALVQERGSDQIARLAIDVAPEAPHHITALDLRAIPRPPELAIARLSDAALVTALREKLERDAASGRFAGAVLVARGGRTLFEGAYGQADRERNVPNSLDTRFRIGSMNKMFTAVAILQLVQQGKIRLDAPIGTYLGGYPNADVASKVTVHHLLTHTGGTGDIFGPQFTAKRLELRTIGDYLKLYGERGLDYEPGARWAYSNYGFILLGAIVERVGGESYYDYVARHVFAPAGMTATGSAPEDSAVAARSVGYTRFLGDTLARNTETLPWRGTSAGGGYSTVRDLARFATALLEHRLLDARHTELLTTGKVDAFGGSYAYGFVDRTNAGVRLVGHGGGAPGMNGELFVEPRSGTVVAVLANLDPPAASRVAEFVVNRVTVPAAPAGGTTP
jgi:CubicO group peptidase (beta-lactamase class C family)